MSLLSSAGTANYIPVADIAAATAWYIEKLGLRKVKVELDDGEDCVALGFSKDDYALCLGPLGRSSEESTHMLNSSNVKKAREFLISQGVNVGEIQQDRQGTHYFEMRDLEGNLIEIAEET
jgi:catechol 2,3-dioxygenase-like lactoylglutathione lyase family enzyme